MPTIGPTIRTLADDFNNNTAGSVWDVYGGAVEQNQRLECSVSPVVDTAGYQSKIGYNLESSHVSWEVNHNTSPYTAASIFDPDTNNELLYYIYDGKLSATYTGSGGPTQLMYNSTTMKWLRVRHAGADISSGSVYWEYSADGRTWSTLYSRSTPFAIGNMKVFIGAFTAGGTGMAIYDNLNTLENSPITSDTSASTDSITVATGFNPTISDTSGASELFIFLTEVLQAPVKSYLYKVYDRGTFLGVWNDVSEDSEISFEESINSAGDGIEVILARNADRVTQQLDVLLTEDGEDLLTEDSQQLVGSTTTANSIGPGTDVQVNFDVEVLVFYGTSEELLTEDGEVLLTEDGEALLFDIGYVMGKPVFIGYISKIEATYGGDEKVRVSVLSYGKELDDYMVEVSDTSSITNSQAGTSYGLGSTFTGDNLTLAQTFTATATGMASRIKLKAALGDVNYATATLSYQLRTGSTIGGGTLLDSGSVPVSSTTPTDINLPVHANPSLTNTNMYHYVLSTDKRKGVAGDPYPILISEGNAYADGALYVGSPLGAYSTPGADLHFTLYTTTGATTASFNSVDPSAIDRTIIDDINFKGSRITYDSSTVENTGTTVSYTFKNNTALEGVRKTVELSPSDWWWRVDVATAMYHKHPKPTTVSHTFILGTHIQGLNVVQSIEGIVNMAYVSGGGDPPIYKRYENPNSIRTYRRGLFRRSDNRITTTSALDLIGEHETTRFAEPRYASQITILSEAYPIEDIAVGQLVGFGNFGNFIDDLQLQIVSKRYEPSKVTLTLDSTLPNVPKRIEDMRRALQELENADLPSTPS